MSTNKLKANNESNVKKGHPSKYFDYSDSAVAAAGDEAVDHFIRSGKYLTPNDAELAKNQVPALQRRSNKRRKKIIPRRAAQELDIGPF